MNNKTTSSLAVPSSVMSFNGSYGSYDSSQSRFAGSYIDPYAHIINPFVIVNGYGINLI